MIIHYLSKYKLLPSLLFYIRVESFFMATLFLHLIQTGYILQFALNQTEMHKKYYIVNIKK